MANGHHDGGRVSLRKLLERLLCEFSRSTSIHGLQHFTHKSRRHPIEHALWVALVAVAAVGAFAVSQAAYQRYLETPSVIAMERDYREWNTSLPAGTLCPHTRVDPIALSRLLSELAANRSAGERAVLGSFLTDLANATYTNFGELRKYLSVPSQLLPPPHRYLDIINKVKMELSFDVSNSLENNAVFSTQTVTELGICWAYNAPFAAYNALSYWQANRWDLLPEGPVVQCHPLSGEVFLQVTNLNSGYQFLLHASSEVADVANRIYASTPALYLSLDLTALSISTSPEAKQLKPSQRRCRLAREPQQQALAPAYAHSLCRVQCRMRLARALCGCVPHFYRPLPGFKICDVRGLVCLADFAHTLVKLRNETTGKKISCSCLSSCDHVTYIPERVDVIPWDLGTNVKWGMTRYPRMRLRRNILFGFTDLLVSIGGAVGLFLGCSVLGCLEITYFFSLRLMLSLRVDRMHPRLAVYP